MKIIVKILFSVLITAFLFTSCQKELSFESFGGGGIVGGGTSEGSLGGAPNTCANTLVLGVYGIGLPLTDSNKVEVEVNFTQAGSYFITTDTVNGIFFSKSGFISTTGTIRIALIGAGTPGIVGIYQFKVKFKATECLFGLNVYPVAIATNDDYFPVTTSSNWTYLSSDPGAIPGDTIRTTSTGAIFSLGSISYNLFTQAGGFGIDSSLYRKASGLYYEYGDLDVAGITTAITPTEYIFLKDNVAVGTSWESPEVGAFIDTVGVKIKLSLSIGEKNVNVLLANKIYRNVIKVRITELALVPGTTYVPVISYESWYAKGIGLINVSAAAPVYGYLVTRYIVN